MQDVRAELAALRRHLRVVLVIAALAAVTTGMGGIALAVAFRAETLDVWTVSTNDNVGSPQPRLSASGDLATTRVQVKNATLELAQQTAAVASPNAGALWYDSNTSQKRLKFYNGSAWVDSAEYSVCTGRLTLETGVAVSTTDQTAKTTVYFTPYLGNRIGLYTGSAWNLYTFSELSLSLSGATANKNNDIFIYDNSGTVTLEKVEWTNDTTRATGLVIQDGIKVKSGFTTKRFLGTIRTTATTGQCEDSITKRFVSNYYNRVQRQLSKQEHAQTTSWSYTTGSWRAWHNDSNNKVEFISNGENPIWVVFNGQATCSSTGCLGIGLDRTNANDALSINDFPSGAVGNMTFASQYAGLPAAGYHYLAVIEYGTGSATFYGYDTSGHRTGALVGFVMA